MNKILAAVVALSCVTTAALAEQTLNLVVPQAMTTYVDQSGSTHTLNIPVPVTIGTLSAAGSPSQPTADGTIILATSTGALVDGEGRTWSFGPNVDASGCVCHEVLRDGQSIGGWFSRQSTVANGGRLYTQGVSTNWWLWENGTFVNPSPNAP